MIALLVDIGNSRIKWRITRVDPEMREPRWITEERALDSNDPQRVAESLAEQAEVAVETVLFSNVASDLVEASVRQSVSRIWPVATLHSLRPNSQQCGVFNGYRDPTRLGPDRWLALIGAHARWPGRTMLVCSFGTATTIDLLVAGEDDSARFVGGLILPGFETMRAALATRTARLPFAAGRTVDFAIDTDDAITSGIAAAQVGVVERAWRRARLSATSSMCLLAGGGAATVASLLGDLDVPFEVAHDLVLRGMAAAVADPTFAQRLTANQAISIR